MASHLNNFKKLRTFVERILKNVWFLPFETPNLRRICRKVPNPATAPDKFIFYPSLRQIFHEIFQFISLPFIFIHEEF